MFSFKILIVKISLFKNLYDKVIVIICYFYFKSEECIFKLCIVIYMLYFKVLNNGIYLLILILVINIRNWMFLNFLYKENL